MSAPKEVIRPKPKPAKKATDQISKEQSDSKTSEETQPMLPDIEKEPETIAEEESVHELVAVPDIYKRRMTKQWFPKDGDMQTTGIVKNLVSTLGSADALTTRDICALLLEIQRYLNFQKFYFKISYFSILIK